MGISGSLTNYIIAGHGTKLSMLLAGDFLALLGICAVGFLASRKEQELEKSAPLNDPEAAAQAATQVSMIRKFTICLIGGLLLGLSNIGVVNATSGACPMSAPA